MAIRGHNNPPELLEPAAEMQRHIGVLASALDDAQAELSMDAPRHPVRRSVCGVLVKVTTAALADCAPPRDVAFRKAAEAVGSAGGRALVATWVAPLEPC